jgi:hypothetical protein
MTHLRRSATAARGFILLLLVGVLAACGAATPSPTTTDPYAILAEGLDASYDRVMVQVGIQAESDAGDITIPPEAITFVVDSAAGAGTMRVALPAEALGIAASDLAAMGIQGDTIELEVLFAGDALYAKSPLFASLLPLLMMQTGQTIEGDLTGWLRLGTAEDFASMAGAMGAAPVESADPDALAALDPAQLKADLEEAGVTVTYVGTEPRDDETVEHVAVAVDLEKLAASDLVDQLPADQLSQLEGVAGDGSLAMNLYFDVATGALREIDVTASGDGQGGTITVLLTDPGDVAIEPPADFADVPVAELFGALLPMIMGGGLTP